MAFRIWASERQRAFLKRNLPQFQNAQEARSAGAWLAAFYRAFLLQYPLDADAGTLAVVLMKKVCLLVCACHTRFLTYRAAYP